MADFIPLTSMFFPTHSTDAPGGGGKSGGPASVDRGSKKYSNAAASTKLLLGPAECVFKYFMVYLHRLEASERAFAASS